MANFEIRRGADAMAEALGPRFDAVMTKEIEEAVLSLRPDRFLVFDDIPDHPRNAEGQPYDKRYLRYLQNQITNLKNRRGKPLKTRRSKDRETGNMVLYVFCLPDTNPDQEPLKGEEQ